MDSRIRTYRHLARAASLLLLLICFHPGHGQQYKVVEYGKESGLPQPYIYTLVQDHTGRLWVGTGKGLARFDGYAFESFTTSDSLSDNFIVVSHANEQGVWFGHMNGGLSLYDGYEFHKVLDGDQGTGSITDMKTLGTTTWVSTQSGGIWRIGSQLEAVRYQDRAQTLFVFAFELLSSSECLVGSMDGIYRYSLDPESDEMSLIGYLEGLPETKIQDIV
jgi:hypothetical protein